MSIYAGSFPSIEISASSRNGITATPVARLKIFRVVLTENGAKMSGDIVHRHVQVLSRSIVVLLLAVIGACPLGAECQLQPRNEC